MNLALVGTNGRGTSIAEALEVKIDLMPTAVGLVSEVKVGVAVEAESIRPLAPFKPVRGVDGQFSPE